MKKIKLEISELVASCLQRMIVDEIENQKWWKSEEEQYGNNVDFRDEIIKEMNKLADDLEKQGIQKYIKCY